jgi:hypothetical protein
MYPIAGGEDGKDGAPPGRVISLAVEGEDSVKIFVYLQNIIPLNQIDQTV